MRLTLRFNAAGRDGSSPPITHDELRSVLCELGWLPVNHGLGIQMRTELLHNLAVANASLAREVDAGDPIAFAPRPRLWGLMSLEFNNRITIRLLSNNLIELYDEAATIVREFPSGFHRTMKRHPIGFEPDVIVRHPSSEQERILAGEVKNSKPDYRFYTYLTKERENNFKHIQWLLIIAIACGALSIYGWITRHNNMLHWDKADWSYAALWFDRIATALIVAILIAWLLLRVEFREWKRAQPYIEWNFSKLMDLFVYQDPQQGQQPGKQRIIRGVLSQTQPQVQRLMPSQSQQSQLGQTHPPSGANTQRPRTVWSPWRRR
ncbi:hypothetical protein ACGF0J_35030 [Nonomuraea sp. NPDC047897]|uniref:hypothetical protein n=1 Tax=Nonomuraea sp. NPDC047897 TaxID=3364346 RepID=UPI00371D1483